HSQIQDLFYVQGLASNQVLECLAFQQLHGDEVLTVRFVDLVNRADVRMIERRSGEGFPLESFAGGRIVLHFYRQELERDMAVQFKIFSFVHHTHAAARSEERRVEKDGSNLRARVAQDDSIYTI